MTIMKSKINLHLVNQSLSDINEWHAFFNLSLPFKAGISNTTTLATTSAPSHLSIRLIAALKVPPVASKSSRIRTFELESSIPF